MADWTLHCPHCGTTNRVPAHEVNLECGTVSTTHVCVHCREAFTAEQPYWRWLGLKEAPPSEDENEEVADR